MASSSLTSASVNPLDGVPWGLRVLQSRSEMGLGRLGQKDHGSGTVRLNLESRALVPGGA